MVQAFCAVYRMKQIYERTVKIVDAPAAKVTKNDSWINQGNAKTDSFEMVDVPQKAGYDSVRLNVSWTPHMNGYRGNMKPM
jgi:hypothetical protein